MPRKLLTDRGIRTLKPAKAGKRYDLMDTSVPGFGVRVNDAGGASFILYSRYPGSRSPERRTLGMYGDTTNRVARVFSLADARAEAVMWKGLIARAIDPRAELQREQRQNVERRANTFEKVAEEFITGRTDSKGRKQEGGIKAAERKGWEVARDIRKELVGAWQDRPITEITRGDVFDVIQSIVARGARDHARNVLLYTRRVFNWAINTGAYDLEHSPCDRIQPAMLVGKKTKRRRVLNDDELRAVWHGAAAIPEPYGPLFQLLLLTGQRKSEIANARRSEWVEADKLLKIPAERMKNGLPHVVPMSADALAIIRQLPERGGGDFYFSTTDGRKPVNGFSKAKRSLDKAAAEKLGRELEPFTIHDLRRTVRTRLSGLKIAEEVREALMSHVPQGVKAHYDLAEYLSEKREALTLWADTLSRLVAPTQPEGGNVLALKRA